MNTLTFGRYSPYNTFVHKLDPRNKIICLILLMVTIFFKFTVWSTSLLMSLTLFILLVVCMLISRVSVVSFLKSLLSMWFLILFLMVMYIFIPNSSYHLVAFKINNYPIYWDSFYQTGYIILRILMMLGLTMILTSSTKPMEMTYGFEWYMTPLKVIKFPAHEIAMTISIALRFIPTLLDETKRIMKAQESRGVDFSHGSLGKKFKAIISLIVPLLVSSFQRSDELADAMEARAYDPRGKRSHYRILRFTYRDIIGILITLIIFGGVLTLYIIDKNYQTLDLMKILFNIELGW